MSRITIVIILLLLTYSLPGNQASTRCDAGFQSQEGSVKGRPSGESKEVQKESQEDAVVRVDTTLVNVPVTVLDRDGRFIANLRQEDFRVFEDGIEQQIAFFAAVERPFRVVLLIDTSGSTRPRQKEIREAAVAFVDQLRPHDDVMVVAFDGRIRVVGKAGKDRESLRKAILGLKWDGGGTLLYGVFEVVLNHFLMRLKGRKALVMLTDGEDTDMRRIVGNTATISGPSCRELPCATYKSNMRDVEESDVLVYSIQFASVDKSQKPAGDGTRQPEVTGEQYLKGLAQKSGGRFYDADKEGSLMQTFNSIAGELRNQYSLGFYAKESAQPGQRRELKVRVSQPGLAVRARSSYIYMPKK